MELTNFSPSAVVSDTSEGVIIIDQEWRCTYINQNAARLINLENPSWVIGKNVREEIPQFTTGAFKDACLQTWRTKVPTKLEVHSDYPERWYENYIIPVDSVIVVMLVDASERKRTDIRLEKANTDLSVLFSVSQKLQKLMSPDQLSVELITILESLLDYTYGAILLIEETDGITMQPFALSRQNLDEQFVEKDKEYIKSRGIRVGCGITGWVAEHGKSVRTGDVASDPRYFAMRQDLCSELCVPLILQDRIIGVVNIESTIANAYSEDDQRLLETVAAQIAISIQNSRLYENILKRAREIEIIHSIGLELTSSLNSLEIHRITLGKLFSLYRPNFVSHLHIHPETNRVTVVDAIGKLPAGFAVGSEVFLDGPLQELIMSNETLLVENTGSDPVMASMVNRIPELGQMTLMLAPLHSKLQYTGEGSKSKMDYISVSKQLGQPFTFGDLKILQSIISVLDITIQNAYLYENLERTYAEREKTLSLLVQSQKMSELGKLAASLAHEINNPLQSIKGCLALLEEEQEDLMKKEKPARYLEIINSEIDRIVGLVRNMREFYQPSKHQVQLVDIHNVLGHVLLLAAKQISSRQIEIQTHLPEVSPKITANSDHLKQIFMNLTLNAIEAMGPGGILRISSVVEPPSSASEVPVILISFSDTGPGIPQDVLDHLFEPFNSTKENGTGLGLYVSRNIVESYGGHLSVHCPKNEGTTFSIRLPIHSPRGVR